MTDPLFYRDIELLLICFGGIFFGYLGYRLFIFGVTEGKSKFEAETQVVRLVFSGTAPGLFFMFAGASILVIALMMQQTHTEGSQTSQSREVMIPKAANSSVGESSETTALELSTETGNNAVTTPQVKSSVMGHGTVLTETHIEKTTTVHRTSTKKH